MSEVWEVWEVWEVGDVWRENYTVSLKLEDAILSTKNFDKTIVSGNYLTFKVLNSL